MRETTREEEKGKARHPPPIVAELLLDRANVRLSHPPSYLGTDDFDNLPNRVLTASNIGVNIFSLGDIEATR
jgi:hypothetical protein